MLHASARTDELPLQDGFSAYAPPRGMQVGAELKRAASRLHDALSRMEEAVAFNAVLKRTAGANDGLMESMREENEHLSNAYADAQQQTVELTHEITTLRAQEARLTAELADMREKNREVSQAVVGLSTKLEALIDRLGKLLEA